MNGIDISCQMSGSIPYNDKCSRYACDFKEEFGDVIWAYNDIYNFISIERLWSGEEKDFILAFVKIIKAI